MSFPRAGAASRALPAMQVYSIVPFLPITSNAMVANTPGSIFFSIMGILVSGICGGVAGWAAVTALEWSGVGAALVAAVIGMVVATAVWTGLTALLRASGLMR